MIRNTVLVSVAFYYPLGNTPAVSLTQDLPPEEDADILLLGCGDARNVLFTCFTDTARKIDMTCCDIEPGIHARNVLLYSLLIDDKENANIERIWNIYYHWKLDMESVNLLETQAEKLLQMSESEDTWHGSVYGACIRFCDSRSLSLIRSYWKGFLSRGLLPAKKKQRQMQLQGAINRAKTYRKTRVGKEEVIWSDLRAATPVGLQAMLDVPEVARHWWNRGTTIPTPEATELNPAFLYTPNEALTLHWGISPLIGFPLSTAYIPISKESAFFLEQKDSSITQHLVNCAMSHFSQWAVAFRRAVEKKSVIRVFCGDALAFCCTLRNCQLTGATSANLFCDNWTNSPLKLDCSDYRVDRHAKYRAPLSFNVVDTSNLADCLGPLNVFATGASLLKYDTSSSLYTEMLIQRDANLGDRLSGFFGVDARTMSLLLGLILPELYTNATETVDDDLIMEKLSETIQSSDEYLGTHIRSRLRWKRLRGFEGAPTIHVVPEALAKLLLQVYEAMFGHENTESLKNRLHLNGPSTLLKQADLFYNRASFALLLNLLRATVISKWDECVKEIYDSCLKFDSLLSVKLNSAQELVLNMHLFGVDNGMFVKLPRGGQFKAILVPYLPISAGEDMPDQLCVTVRVPRDKLKIFTSGEPGAIGYPALVCGIEGGDPGEAPWLSFFSAVQIAFGKWHSPTNTDLFPFIDEDTSQLSGDSDLFASFLVPTSMLLVSHHNVPLVQVRLAISMLTTIFSKELGGDLCFFRSKMTSKNVFITRFMPGMSGLPTLALASTKKEVPELTLDALSLRLADDGSIESVMRGMIPNCPMARAKLRAKASEVKVKFDTPLIASIKIEDCPKIKFEFPLPVSPSECTFMIKKKFVYIEIESSPFDPLKEKTASFMFPTFVTKTPGGTVPTPWTSTRINLDVMPPIDLKDTQALSWLTTHTTLMFSNRERCIRQSNSVDARTDLKDSLFHLFILYTGVQGQKADLFGLSKSDEGIQTLIIPSCLRLDLVNRSVVLDAVVIPLTLDMLFNDPKAPRLLWELKNYGLFPIPVSETDNRAWKAMMPALVERCRTWKHSSDCEYKSAGEALLSKTLAKDGILPICKCGIGKFPSGDYLKQTKRIPELGDMVRRYGTRIAIAPIFALPYVEDCFLKGVPDSKIVSYGDDEEEEEKCVKCKKGKKGLLSCTACRRVKYCSRDCQKADWKKHKQSCSK